MNLNPMATYHKFLAEIHEPLIGHLANPDLGGVEFADWLIRSKSNGQEIYEGLRSQGKDNIVMVIRSYTPLWESLQPYRLQFDPFLDDFLQAPEIMAEEAAEAARAQGMSIPQPQPQPQSIPANRIEVMPPASTPAPKVVLKGAKKPLPKVGPGSGTGQPPQSAA